MNTKKPGVLAAAAAGSLVCLLAVSCKNDSKPPPNEAVSKTTIVKGKAGGVYEDSFTAYATVREVDPAARRVVLETGDGRRTTFNAPPEVRNLAQLKAGDRVKATISERMTILVDKTSAQGADYASVSGSAPKGAKPGAIVAESYELVGTVKSIDTAKRRATLQFMGGETRTVPVREDVDLTKYNVGDSVVIRVDDTLSVVTESP
jgi:hypothetical protein